MVHRRPPRSPRRNLRVTPSPCRGGPARRPRGLRGPRGRRRRPSFRIARLVLRDVQLAEDAVQEALVKAWRELPSLRDPDRFDAWLHRLLVNACADQGRRHRSRAGGGPDPPARAVRPRQQPGLRRSRPAGTRLQAPEARATGRLVLHFYLGLSVPEIADTLGVPVATVKSRLHYATAAMRATLEADARRPVAAANGRLA